MAPSPKMMPFAQPVSLHRHSSPTGPGAGEVQVMQLRMHPSLFSDLIACINSEQPPNLVFGPSPMLEFNNQAVPLHSAPDRFVNEIYRHSSDSPARWDLVGHQSHTLSVSSAKKKTDPTLEALKLSLAQAAEEKLAKSTMRVDISKAKLAGPRGRLAVAPAPPSVQTIPATPTPLPTPSVEKTRRKAILAGVRHVVVHLLAANGPMTLDELRKAVCVPPEAEKEFLIAPLQVVATPSKPGSAGPWKLRDKSFRDLNAWEFPYKTEEVRSGAIENAIKAFDRLRITPTDPTWQLLITPADRNKGKTLSRLKLAQDDHEQPPGSARQLDRSTGLLRQKKKPAEKAEREKPADREDEPKPARAAPKKAAAASAPAADSKARQAPVGSKTVAPASRPSTGDSRPETKSGTGAAKVKSPSRSPGQSGFLFKPGGSTIKRKTTGASAAINSSNSNGPAAGSSRPPSSAPPGSSGWGQKTVTGGPASGSPGPPPRQKTAGGINGRSITQTGAGVTKSTTAAKAVPKTAKVTPAKLDRNKRTEKMDRVERNERVDRADRGDRMDRHDRPERPDRQDRSERQDRNDRPDPPRPAAKQGAGKTGRAAGTSTAAASKPASGATLKRKPDPADLSPRLTKTRKTEPAPKSGPGKTSKAAPTKNKSTGLARKTPTSIPSPVSSRSSPGDATGNGFAKESVSSTSSSSAPDEPGAADQDDNDYWSRRTAEFHRKYDVYQTFHQRLAQGAVPTEDEIRRLRRMRSVVENLKREIWEADGPPSAKKQTGSRR